MQNTLRVIVIDSVNHVVIKKNAREHHGPGAHLLLPITF